MEVTPMEDLGGVFVRETRFGRFQLEVVAGAQRLFADEPVDAGGLGSGPSPYEFLATALGACTAMTLRLYAERKNWPVHRIAVRVLHARPDLQSVDRFAREITIEGDLDEAQRRAMLAIADRCPVHRTLERGSVLTTVLTIPGGELRQSPVMSDHAAHGAECCARA